MTTQAGNDERPSTTPVIDFRVRPSTARILAAMSPTGEAMTGINRWGHQMPTPVPSIDEFVKVLDTHGIDRAVFTGRQWGVAGDAHGTTNDLVAETVAAHPDRITGFASADLRTGVTASIRELRRAIDELHLSGISVDPFWYEFSADDRRLYPVYELASEYGVPVVITVGPLVDAEWADPTPIDRVAADFPETNFLLSHGCYPYVTELVALGYRRQNVYFEPSLYYALPGSQPFIEAAKGFLQDRVIYASAYPLAPLDIKDHFAETYDLSGEVRKKLMGGNAAAFLGISAS